jgi:hypothetical protein
MLRASPNRAGKQNSEAEALPPSLSASFYDTAAGDWLALMEG